MMITHSTGSSAPGGRKVPAANIFTAPLTLPQRRGLVLASRGDALSPYLFDVLARRYPVSGTINPELTPGQRLTVAAGSFRPSRTRWSEQFYKSHHGYRMRSANATRQWATLRHPQDVILQVHALFEVADSTSLLYVDCTHEQSARLWPAWNPLRGAGLARWYEREQRAYAQARHIFAFSQETRHSLINAYAIAPERVSVVGAGANLEQLPDLSPSQERRPGSLPMNVLFVGNDFTRKGGHVLLEAFARVRVQLPQARLQLVGADPGIAAQPGVDVLGRIHDRARVHQLYGQATVFALPSLFDPMPLVLLEAMAHGLPCITTPSVGIPDIITDGRDGLLVGAGDPRVLAEALLQMLTDPAAAARVGTAARARIEDAFTWEHVADRMAPVLDLALN